MRLSDSLIEIIAYTALVTRDGGAAQLPFEQVQGKMQQLIGHSESLAAEHHFSQEDYQLGRFAVFAWVDETILSSNWEGRHQWQRDPLQRKYFQTSDAGELFYERLNTIGPHQRDVREVYYLCLSLGFTGQYINAGDDFMLEQLRVSNLKLLTGSSTGVPTLENRELFPESYPVDSADGPRQPKKRSMSGFTVICAAAPLVLFGVLYIIYHFILGSIGDNLIGTVP